MKKLTPEKLQELMEVALNHASSGLADSDGAVNGFEVYINMLVDRINEFFAGELSFDLPNVKACPDCGGVDSHEEDCWINHITASRA